MTRTIHLLAVGLIGVVLGCDGDEPPGLESVDCTADIRPSISLIIVDEGGVPIPSATASYAVDGGEEQDCEGAGSTLACGREEAGEFAGTVQAEGFNTDTFYQVVEADECHVMTEDIEYTMSPVDCTAQAFPSGEVWVTDSQGLEVTSGNVVWNMAAEDDLPEPCEYLKANRWTCGWEVEGDLVIEIDQAGPYQPFAQEVTVGSDECGVLTESLSAVLQYLDD